MNKSTKKGSQKTQVQPVVPDIQKEQELKDRTEEATKKVMRVVADIGIDGLFSRVDVDPTGKVPTACWKFFPKEKKFQIVVGLELSEKLDEEGLRIVLEHELLHHVWYRACDIHSVLMSNLVLDIAINKTLYLHNPNAMTQASSKIYEIDKMLAESSPILLACPLLDASQIEAIQDDKVREAYIEIWGSRKTVSDFNAEVPVPLNLYYKLAEFIPDDTYMNGPFGEMEEGDDGEDGDDFQDGQDGQDGQSGKPGKTGKSGKSGKQKRMKRCEMPEDQDQDKDQDGRDGASAKSKKDEDQDQEKDGSGAGDSDEGKKDEEGQEGDQGGKGKDEEEDEEKDQDEEAEGASDESGDDEDDQEGDQDGDGDEEADGGDSGKRDEFSDFEDDIASLAEVIETGVSGGAGKGRASITFARSFAPKIDTRSLDEVMREMVFEQTLDEVAELVKGSFRGDVARQVYAMNPTRSTITYMAAGVTKFMPVYWNKVYSHGKPKVGVYVDVSGSMSGSLKLVQAIMVKLSEYLPSSTFVFHDSVCPMPTEAWNDVVPSGGGTSFAAVLQHACMDLETKRQWVESWLASINSKSGRGDNDYYSSSYLDNQFSKLIRKYQFDYDVIGEDFPVVLMITDGEDSISPEIRKMFENTGKKLLVLHIVDSDGEANNYYGSKGSSPFDKFAEMVFVLNRNAQIIKKVYKNEV